MEGFYKQKGAGQGKSRLPHLSLEDGRGLTSGLPH